MFFKMVKHMFKKVSKIFKLRMRSSTFPSLNIADLARVMRDLGLIPNIKGGMKKVKEVWFKVKAECSEPEQASTEHCCTGDLGPKRDHI